LKVTHYQHCTAHALHRLLTVDSIHQVDDIVQVLQRCREIVTTLHFKFFLLDEEMAAQHDKSVTETLKERVATASDIIELDNQFSLSHEGNTKGQGESVENKDRTHHHITLKAACPTRWNSALVMIDSVLDLKDEAENALKRLGHLDRCVSEIEWNLLTELHDFLSPFKTFTDIVSCSNPTLSLVPVMKMKIRKLKETTKKPNPAVWYYICEEDHLDKMKDNIKKPNGMDPVRTDETISGVVVPERTGTPFR